MKTAVTNIFSNASKKAAEITQGKTFYIGEKGLKHCSVCHKRLEHLISVPHLSIKDMKVNCICACGAEQKRKYREELKQIERSLNAPVNRNIAFSSPEMAKLNFDFDDSKGSEQSNLCRRWVAHYEANKARDNMKWLFMYGGCGTGKTFYACCIANAMISKGYTVKVSTPSDIEAEIYNAKDKVEIYKKYTDYELLVIDDFASERKSDYMYEILFTVINNRYNDHKPIIFTSNMTTSETGNPQDKRIERIMSRIWERGYPIEFSGTDRRKKAWNADNHDTR